MQSADAAILQLTVLLIKQNVTILVIKATSQAYVETEDLEGSPEKATTIEIEVGQTLEC